MSIEIKGEFSTNFFTLQLQLKSLLEGAGGEEAAELLDAVARLNHGEQRIALKIFTRVARSVLSGDKRLCAAEDQEAKAFEDGLYQDIVAAIDHAAKPQSSRGLEVLDGGKAKPQPARVVALSEFRKARRAPHLN